MGAIRPRCGAAITLQEPYGPPGGLPGEARVDRGKDFLSKTVASVLAEFAVKVEDLPGYTPHLTGSVETVNGAAGQMFCAGLPRYSGAQRLANGCPVDPDAPALTFEAFVGELLAARACPATAVLRGWPTGARSIRMRRR